MDWHWVNMHLHPPNTDYFDDNKNDEMICEWSDVSYISKRIQGHRCDDKMCHRILIIFALPTNRDPWYIIYHCSSPVLHLHSFMTCFRSCLSVDVTDIYMSECERRRSGNNSLEDNGGNYHKYTAYISVIRVLDRAVTLDLNVHVYIQNMNMITTDLQLQITDYLI